MSFGSLYARWFHSASSYAATSYAATTHEATSRAAASHAAPSGAPASTTTDAPALVSPSPLPTPILPPALAEMMQRRVSCRRFSSAALTAAQLGVLLHAGYGVIERRAPAGEGEPFPPRTVPSAGACYPLHLYVLVRGVSEVECGAHRYDAGAHRLTPVGPRAQDDAIAEMFLGQPYVARAAAIVVMVAELGKTLERYADRGYRYILFEAGHVGQNIALCAAAEGIASLAIGGFLDGPLAAALRLPSPALVPVYAAAVGYPEQVSLP